MIGASQRSASAGPSQGGQALEARGGRGTTGFEFLARAGLEYHMLAVLDCEEPLKVSEEGEEGAITVSQVDSKEAEKHSPRNSLWPL